MKIFYGGAIQGDKTGELLSRTHGVLISYIKELGFELISEHTTGTNYEERMQLLETAIGSLPPKGPERTAFVRNKMIEGVESDIKAAIFEVSMPSLGTGIEIAHAYLRPRMNLMQIPILFLYERDFWPNNLSTMIRGLTKESSPSSELKEYSDLDEAKLFIKEFVEKFK